MGLAKRAAVLVAGVLIAAGCGDTSDSASTTTVLSSTSAAVVTSSTAASTTQTQSTIAETTTSSSVVALGGDCLGLGEAPNTSMLTFTYENRIYEVAADGTIRCLVEHSSSNPSQFVWGAAADKVLFADGQVITEDAGRGSISGIKSAGFSRPTGTSTIWIQDGLLNKASVNGSQARVLDVETLEFGNEVDMERAAYHPDGKHILVSYHAPSEDTSFIYVADNEGGTPSVLVIDEGATVQDLQLSPDGTRVFFVVDHSEGHRDLHLLDMEAAIEEIEDENGVASRFLQPSDQNQIETLLTGDDPIHNLVMANDGQRVMAAQGECGAGSRSYLMDLEGNAQLLLADQNTVPVGFLDNQRLGLILLDPTCDGGGDLVTLDLSDGSVEFIQANVDGAAVRSLLPAAQMSLSDVIIAGFA